MDSEAKLEAALASEIIYNTTSERDLSSHRILKSGRTDFPFLFRLQLSIKLGTFF